VGRIWTLPQDAALQIKVWLAVNKTDTKNVRQMITDALFCFVKYNIMNIKEISCFFIKWRV
jgi:hypothetical protein